MKLKKLVRRLKPIQGWSRQFMAHDPLTRAASMSYYTLLSMAPLVLVVIGVAGMMFGRGTVEKRLLNEIESLIGPFGTDTIRIILENQSTPQGGVVAITVGIVALLIGATAVFIQLQDALNKIWEVEPKKNGNFFWSFLKDRLISLAMVFGLGFLLLVSLVISAALSAAGAYFNSDLPGSPLIWQIVNQIVSLAVITVVIGMIFKFLPDAKITWSNVSIGAAITAVLFTIGKFLIGLYLGRATIGSAYGAAGSVVVFVVWVYYAALIFFIGAQITQVVTERRQGRIKPAAHAKAAVAA